MMKIVTTLELGGLLDEGRHVLLVDVLPAALFAERHIAGAVNVPADADDFAGRVLRAADGDRRRRDVVYSADIVCGLSSAAAKKLDAAGFREVYDYGAGIEGWALAGRPVVGVPPNRRRGRFPVFPPEEARKS